MIQSRKIFTIMCHMKQVLSESYHNISTVHLYYYCGLCRANSSPMSTQLFFRVSPGQWSWLPQGSGPAWTGEPAFLQWKHKVAIRSLYDEPFLCFSHCFTPFFFFRSASSSWSKAVDCALQFSGTVEKWDGVSYGGGSLLQTLKQAGLWGCLQAAVLTAKIAQYVLVILVNNSVCFFVCIVSSDISPAPLGCVWICRHILTSDISQRTKCCLLSAHLFKVIKNQEPSWMRIMCFKFVLTLTHVCVSPVCAVLLPGSAPGWPPVRLS